MIGQELCTKRVPCHTGDSCCQNTPWGQENGRLGVREADMGRPLTSLRFGPGATLFGALPKAVSGAVQGVVHDMCALQMIG